MGALVLQGKRYSSRGLQRLKRHTLHAKKKRRSRVRLS
jgi:hypothetical protein